MKRRYFGTDGIRGRAGVGALAPDFLQHFGAVLGEELKTYDHAPMVIGCDTRESSSLLMTALASGVMSTGMQVHYLGVVPTPAVAFMVRHLNAAFGVMISASHNPYHDNGVKVFGREGTKLSDAVELALENRLAMQLKQTEAPACAWGQFETATLAAPAYQAWLRQTFAHLSSMNLKLVVDCAHGAFSSIAGDVLTALGFEVVLLHASPDGRNINDNCGATQPQRLQEAVTAQGADLGIAFDGDGDRLQMVDAQGRLIDGDALLYVWARYAEQKTAVRGVVGTVMTNAGIESALADAGIRLVRADVGDRHVLAKQQELGWLLGGESSGHLLHLSYTTTGDGLLSALLTLDIVARSGKPLSTLLQDLSYWPQVLVNVPLPAGCRYAETAAWRACLSAAQQQLGSQGRVLIRPSGTEPVVRVMVEAKQAELAQSVCDTLVAALPQHLTSDAAL